MILPGAGCSSHERTEILRENDHGDGVDDESGNLGDDHPRVPILNQVRVKMSHIPVMTVRRATHHVVISRATMMSSFNINEVNEMATMLMNSDSKRNKESSMMTLPLLVILDILDVSGGVLARNIVRLTLIYADHKPDEESLGGQRSALCEKHVSIPGPFSANVASAY